MFAGGLHLLSLPVFRCIERKGARILRRRRVERPRHRSGIGIGRSSLDRHPRLGSKRSRSSRYRERRTARLRARRSAVESTQTAIGVFRHRSLQQGDAPLFCIRTRSGTGANLAPGNTDGTSQNLRREPGAGDAITARFRRPLARNCWNHSVSSHRRRRHSIRKVISHDAREFRRMLHHVLPAPVAEGPVLEPQRRATGCAHPRVSTRSVGSDGLE